MHKKYTYLKYKKITDKHNRHLGINFANTLYSFTQILSIIISSNLDLKNQPISLFQEGLYLTEDEN